MGQVETIFYLHSIPVNLVGVKAEPLWSSPAYTDPIQNMARARPISMGQAHITPEVPAMKAADLIRYRIDSRSGSRWWFLSSGSGGRKEPNGGSGQLSDHAISGQTYGTIDIDALLAGSGGGGKLANGGSVVVP